MFKTRQNYILLTFLIILVLLGFVTLLSTEIDIQGVINWNGLLRKQLILIAIGIAIYWSTLKFDVNYLRYPVILGAIYILTIVLLIATKLWAPTINGVQRWLVIGGFQIQVAEFAKIFVILLTASAFTYKNRFNEWLILLVTFILILPILALIYIQPHGSMTVLILGIWAITSFVSMDNVLRNSLLILEFISVTASILFFTFGNVLLGLLLLALGIIIFVLGIYSRGKTKSLFVIMLIAAALFGGILTVSWNNILKDYQQERITSFFAQDTQEECDNCFNVEQSLIAIGAGGVWGRGFGYGTQSRLQFLPEHQTDFIFATYAEQFGLVGSLFLIFIYAGLIFTMLYHSQQYLDSPFASAVIIGIAAKLLLEVFVNIGTNLGVIPATGSPLPFMSAGGSIMLASFFSIGLVQSIIAKYNKSPNVKDFVDNEELLI